MSRVPSTTPADIESPLGPVPGQESNDLMPGLGVSPNGEDRLTFESGLAEPAHGPSDAFLSIIPHEFARRHLILSNGFTEGHEQLFVAESTPLASVLNVRAALRRPVATKPMIAEDLATKIDRAYAGRKGDLARSEGSADADVFPIEMGDAGHDVDRIVRDADADLLNTGGKSQLVRLVDLFLFEAVHRGASDVHVQPLRDHALVRYRLDGVLHTVRQIPSSLVPGLVSRVKVMARLDVAETRTPQDGRATVTLGLTPADSMAAGVPSGAEPRAHRDGESGRRIDLRISTLPTTYGERLVLRLLDQSKTPHLLHFGALGMPPEIADRFQAQAARTSGIVLVTGPTGSGKTTTLYTTLAWITSSNSSTQSARGGGVGRGGGGGGERGERGERGGERAGERGGGCELNIMTIEDPVEYDLSTAGLAISQTQLSVKKGVTFAAGLRHILRQDPDVIMVGEIRDEETARTAVQASLTGHLVLSTLHTNDAPSAVARLLDLNVEPFLVSSSLSAVLAQRLVRKVHASCAGTGCDACAHTGFQGRIGLFELLVLDDELRHLVDTRAPAGAIKAAACANGMTTLHQSGEQLVQASITTRTELLRILAPPPPTPSPPLSPPLSKIE